MTTLLTVASTEAVTPTMRRVWFRSDDLSAFIGSTFTDRYVKLAFPEATRTYTALFVDVAAGTLAIDFVTHGDTGVAGPWAQRARAGDTVEARGPGGAYRPDPTADWHLLVGDESALPAITAALDVLSFDAIARVVLLVDSADHEPDLMVPAGAEVRYVHRSEDSAKDAAEDDDRPQLERAVREIDWLPGRVAAFVHGEANEVMHGLRPYLLRERGLDRDQVSISGYWRRGRTEEGFREWKRELAAVETTPA